MTAVTDQRPATPPAADPNWRQHEPCARLSAHDIDLLFFPLRGHRAREVAAWTAHTYCADCPVQQTCRAATPDDVGVVGGEYRVLRGDGLLVTTDYLTQPPATTVRKVTQR